MVVVERTWECHCGTIKAKLTGEPILTLWCHCHSCIASARLIEERTKHHGKDNRISVIHEETGGACTSPYAASQIEFVTPLSDGDGKSLLKFVKVGEKGSPWRCYTTCCGSQMTQVVFPKMIAFNTNGIKNKDGTKYIPPPIIYNNNAQHAFDPPSVPEPKVGTLRHFSYFLKFAWNGLINPMGKKLTEKELFPDNSDVEVVPITW